MVPDFLLDDLSVPGGSISEQLAAAQALVPEQLLTDSGQDDEIRTCVELEYYHFWMNALQHVGMYAEQSGLDAELPAEFWIHVAAAAHLMEFPEFVPYLLGKAKGLEWQDPLDAMAAFVTMPELAGMPDDLRGMSRRAADLIRRHAAEAGPMLDQGDLNGLAEHMRSGAYEEISEDLSILYSDAFDELYGYVTDPSFPEEHRAHFWAIVGANQFVVQLGEEGTLFALTTHAEVWWRAN